MATDILLEAPPTIAPPIAGDDPLYEIIDNQRVELPPMSTLAAVLSSDLVYFLGSFARTQSLGRAVAEVLFRLPVNGNRSRRPDGAFVSYQRWPKDRPIPARGDAWEVVPNLAVEVVSPHDLVEELFTKLDEYFHAGVEQVWVAYPNHNLLQVYDSLTQVRGLTRNDTLDGGSVLPGFQLPLASLFQAPGA